MTAPTVLMKAPPSFGGMVTTTPSGTIYVPDSNGEVRALYADVATLGALGFVSIVNVARPINLLTARNSDMSVVAASASSGKFGYSYSAGSSLNLVSEAANNSTITDTVILSATVPDSLGIGDNPTLDINAHLVIGSGTVSAKTLVVSVYPVVGDGTLGANVVSSGGTITLGNSAAVSSVVLSGTSLTAGQQLVVSGVMNIVETSTHAVTGVISSGTVHL